MICVTCGGVYHKTVARIDGNYVLGEGLELGDVDADGEIEADSDGDGEMDAD